MEAALAVGISVTVIMLSSFIFDRLKLPNILGVLVAGILMGPYSPLSGASILGLDFNNILITDPSLISVFAVMGSALILLGIGLEFSVVKLVELGAFTFVASAVKNGIVYFFAYSSLSLLGFNPQAAALMSIAISLSSTTIIVKLMESSGKMRRGEVPFIMSMVVLEDLIAVFFIGLIAKPSADLSEYAFAISLLRVVLTFIFAYFVRSKLIGRFLKLVAHSDELLLLSTVSFVLVVGYVSESIGLSFSVGAFLAGSTIAGAEESRRIGELIKPFNALFAAFFFFSIGLMVDPGSVATNAGLLALFLVLGLAVRFAASGMASYFIGFPGRSACFCAAAFLPMCELSLMLVSQGASSGLVSHALLGVFATSIIISAFFSAWLMNRENESYNALQNFAPQIIIKNLRLLRSTITGMRRAVSETSRYYKVVDKLPSISHPSEQLSARETLILTSKNAIILAFISSICFAGIYLMQVPDWSFLEEFFIFIFAGFFISSAIFIVNVKSSSSALLSMMLRSSSGGKYAALGHLFCAILFFCLSMAYLLAYNLAPASLAIILVLPPAVFFFRSFISAVKLVHSGGMRL